MPDDSLNDGRTTKAEYGRALGELAPSVFENLVYDLVVKLGFANVVWRTPGADGGRDIEANFIVVDAIGEQQQQKWYIECKRYSSSLDWPTVHQKIAYADAHDADFLLVATNSNPSPNCETQITAWNSSKRLKVRFLRGYQLEANLRAYPDLTVKYGLTAAPEIRALAFQSILFEVLKIIQSGYAAATTGSAADNAFKAASTLAELIQQRVADIDSYGRPTFSTVWSHMPEGSLGLTAPLEGSEEVGLSAFLHTLAYVTGASTVSVEGVTTGWQAHAVGPKIDLSPSAQGLLLKVASWTNIEVAKFGTDHATFSFRRGD